MWIIVFQLEVPEEVSEREAMVTINDALQAMADRQDGGWSVRKIELRREG